uniref:Uncharacterized protein n=1 Tax=Melopsittacus undulatus TaxID=13146 RepID=A0A8V5FJZ2_MELUD
RSLLTCAGSCALARKCQLHRFNGISAVRGVSMASNSSALPRVTFQTPEKPEEESSHRKLGKLTIKYNRKDLQRWLDLEEWINTQLQELYQCRVIFVRYLIATCYSMDLECCLLLSYMYRLSLLEAVAKQDGLELLV